MQDKGKRIKDKLLLAVFVLLTMVGIDGIDARAEENCPLDWHPPPCGIPPEPKSVQSPEQKQRTKKWVERIDQATFYVDSLAAVSAVYCAASSESDMCANTRMYISVAVGLRVARWWINLTDPFDPQYAVPYDPPFPDLGLSCETNLGCWINERLGSVAQFLDGVYTSMNRSQSCLDLGRDDCFEWQKKRMEMFIWAAGIHLELVGDGMSFLADHTEDWGLAGATADLLYAVADEMKQECPQC